MKEPQNNLNGMDLADFMFITVINTIVFSLANLTQVALDVF